MRVAFYAPLKPPGHPHPSGDRRMARLLMRALRLAGHEVMLASSFRAYDRAGDAAVQQRIAAKGTRIAAALIERHRARPKAQRPQAWVTYHLYHKAPDYLGPTVAAALNIPYIVIEPSVAPSKRNGPWAAGYEAALDAISRADAALCLNTVDPECVRPVLKRGTRLAPLRPFLDAAPYARAALMRARHRRALKADDAPLLLAVGMFRPGDKLDSYKLLAQALARIADRPWRLLIVGDGDEKRTVKKVFATLKQRVEYLGEKSARAMPAIYAACDLYVWPAVREAYGMAMLEAQASGLPVVAGRGVGVGDVVADRRTGMLVASDDPAALARETAALLDDPERRRRMGKAALANVQKHHDLAGAARLLDQTLRDAVRRKRA